MTSSAFNLGFSNGNLLGVQAFKASGTYTPTTGTKHILVRAWGAGGGGAASNNGIGGGGGGGGAYVEAYFANSTSATITIGAGGTGALAGNASNATAGGSTSFGTIVIAAGGSAQANGNNPGAPGATIAACTAPAGSLIMPGGAGGDTNSVTLIPNGGSSFGNLSQAYYLTPPHAGVVNTGQGGAGGLSVSNGGNGGDGLLVIYEFS